jgi:hypothetical protein
MRRFEVTVQMSVAAFSAGAARRLPLARRQARGERRISTSPAAHIQIRRPIIHPHETGRKAIR